jgi:hypothetical protein
MVMKNLMNKKILLLCVFILELLLFAGCTSTDSDDSSKPDTSDNSYTSNTSKQHDELLLLDSELNCDRYHFLIKYPSAWSGVADEARFETPDEGIRIYIEKKENAFIYAFGDNRGQIDPGMAGNEGNTISDFSTTTGINGKIYSYIDVEGTLWKTAIFGDNDEYAIILKMDYDIYIRYEQVINAVMNSFEFIY